MKNHIETQKRSKCEKSHWNSEKSNSEKRKNIMRAPYQTLTILYKEKNTKILYGIFYRNSHPIWQFVSGGGEDNETPLETVVREIMEETYYAIL